MLPTLLLAACETALAQALRFDPDIADELTALHGQVLAFELTGFGVVYCLPVPRGLQLLGDYEGAPHVVVRASPWQWLHLGLMGATPGVGELTFLGDIGLAHRLGSILERLDPDWEEALSRLTGDPLAHWLGRGVRDTLAWLRKSAGTARDDLGEVLTEEMRLLPTRYEVTEFLDVVDQVRDASARLEARVRRLFNHLDIREGW